MQANSGENISLETRLVCVLSQFTQCHLKIMLTDVSAIVGTEGFPRINDQEFNIT